MLDLKNISPGRLAVYTAFVLALPLAVIFYFVEKESWLIAFTAFALIFIVAYLLISYVLDKFIYRKIKLIYKYIYQTKASMREEMYYKYVLPSKSIEEVNEDVQKWAQQQTEEIASLRSNELYRKEFLQNISHEIKTPIFSIQGYIDTLLSGALSDENVNIKFLENAARNVNRLVSLVNDLDEITKLETGEQPLHKETFIIQDAVREVFASLMLQATERKINYTIKKGCESPVEVFADRKKILQVLSNIIENAIKYGKEGGHIVAGVYRTDDSHVLIEISDNGVGIAEDHLPRIFERFYRTDKGRSRNVGGTGLGLAIAKHIIEAHGQSIHVRSKLGTGTTFGFTLKTRRS